MFTLWICLMLTPVNTCSTWQWIDYRTLDDCVNRIADAREDGETMFAFCAPTQVRT